jgi:hypothetical protein
MWNSCITVVYICNRCECGQCEVGKTAAECQCCAETTRIQDIVEEEVIECITEHQVFIDNCLNINVLHVCMYEYLQNDGPLDDNQVSHE